jgi:tRNA U34 2-thiouridine synthase MnmA/TrmU
MNRKAIALISGGLDSALAIHMVKEQGIEVIGVHFTSFFSPIKDPERASAVTITAEQLEIPIMFSAKGEDFLDIIKNPKYGHGKNLNPCIDCRIYTLKRARRLMEEHDASFMVTGEVVGQRPMSQRKDTIRFIEKRAFVDGLVVRPLSARILPASEPEQQGILDRGRFMDIAGRGRKRQLSLASEIGLSGFSPPAGGCLLTDQTFSRRLRDLLNHDVELSPGALSLLKVGRHIRISDELKVVVARNEAENKLIAENRDLCAIFEPEGFPGPSAIVQGKLDTHARGVVAAIILRYSRERDRGDRILVREPNGVVSVIQAHEAASNEWIQSRIV